MDLIKSPCCGSMKCRDCSYQTMQVPIQVWFFQGLNERRERARLMNVLDIQTMYQTQMIIV